MTQSVTVRSMFRLLPGHISTPEGAGRETESIVSPYTLQQMTFVFGGVSPLAIGDYVVPFVTVANGTVPITINSDGTKTFAAATDELAAAINANDSLLGLLLATSNGATTVTTIARSANTSLPLPVTTVPGADTLTASITVAAAAPSLRMGLFYVYGSPTFTGALTNTPRGCRVAALPAGAAVADIRGVVARAQNQTTLSPTFIDGTTNDAYLAGSPGYGCLRGEVDVVIDPASGPLDAFADAVYVVVAAGTYSVIGAVADAADGGNTVRLDNTTPVRARVTAAEETFVFGSYSGRCVRLKVNQTN